MKKYLYTGLLFILVGITYMYKEDFIRVYNKYFLTSNKIDVKIKSYNDYYKSDSYNFVQNVNNFSPESIQDIYNIYYTAINAGKKKFTFYCSNKYDNCLKDIKYIANDQKTLSNINNFIHPYNSFRHIETTYDTAGKITIEIERVYSDDDINIINTKINEIEKELKDPTLSTEEQIKKYHDYIINTTKYDSNRSDNNVINYKSDTAYGTLIEGYSLCGGYADSMAILLGNLGVTNYKISSENHVWNAIKLNDKWYHLDLTWDDPVVDDGTELLEHDFFLIDTNKLLEIEKNEHNFDQEVYSELKAAN